MKSGRLFRISMILCLIGAVGAFTGIYQLNQGLRFAGFMVLFTGALMAAIALGKGLSR